MENNVVICGTGGQGVLSAGTLLAYAGLEAKKMLHGFHLMVQKEGVDYHILW